MRRFPLDLILAGLATLAALAVHADDLKFEATAWLRQARSPAPEEQPRQPELKIHCREPGCTGGTLAYDVLVDGKGEVEAVRLSYQFGHLSGATRAAAAQAVRKARWDDVTPGRTRRGWRQVTVLPPERIPTRHVPFPDTDGKPISISLERTGCFGTCPAYSALVRSDGTVYFCGLSNVRALGWQTGRITPEDFDELVDRFRRADVFSLADRYVAEVTDGPTYIVGIRIGDHQKVIVDYLGEEVGMPSVVTRLEEAVDKAAGTGRWITPAPNQAGASLPWPDCSTPPTPFND